MIKSDLVLKILGKFKDSISIVYSFKKKEKYEDALNAIDLTFKDLFRLSLKSFNALSIQNILEMVKIQDMVDVEKCIIISKLFEEEASITELQGDLDNSLHLYSKSLNLMLYAYKSNNSPNLSEYYKDIEPMIDKIDMFDMNLEEKSNLFFYYEEEGSYSKAEDVLFDMLDSSEDTSDIVNKGKEFYNRLLKKDKEELEEGNLPYEEVLQGIEELKKLEADGLS